MMPFIECSICSKKSGMPVLCDSCVNNRQTIENLEYEVAVLKNRIIVSEDRYQLERIKNKVIAHLKSQDAALSPRNMVHAMFNLNYAEWIGDTSKQPICEYE